MIKETFYMSVGELKPNPEKVARLITALEGRGFKLKDIAEKCGASSSDVSNWKGAVEKKKNSYLPRKEQYEIMVSMYEHKIPGEKFHHCEVFKSLKFQFPEGWEKEMIARYVNEHAEREFGYRTKSFDQIEETHFQMLLKSESEERGASYDALTDFREKLEAVLLDYDQQLEEAEIIQQEEESEYQKKLKQAQRFITDKTSDEDLKELYERFDVVKGGTGEFLKEEANRRILQFIEKGPGLVPDFKKHVTTDEQGGLIIKDLKRVASELLAEITGQAKARKAADEARYEQYKIIGHVDAPKLATLEKEYLILDVDFAELMKTTKLFSKEHLHVFTGINEFVEIPLEEALQEWFVELSSRKYLELATEEVNISGELLCQSRANKIPTYYDDDNLSSQFEIYALYSNRLMLIEKTKWQGRQLTVIHGTVTLEDILARLGDYAYQQWTCFEYDDEDCSSKKRYYDKLKDLLIANGYIYPGVRTIV
ncbi:hypothetical protein [Halodesulfovibrio sp. MK-HDV]|uniref:hypothetical protein n=1 Tax=Halodesulfovibrio sp. MK-HDV TaxID=2599925 RepID=UPI00136AAC9B|nr:hypothetical protein [Halodesulfovibrio sp. MK-HDV]KAF1077471.1 hypothetical protein MKHDV_00537 [Halodesulfovibrio sp. MK-HDV]